MNNHQAIKNIDNLSEKLVHLQGFLIVMRHECYIAPDEPSWENKKDSILIVHQNLEDELNKTVPGWVGGPGYQDDIEIEGILRKSTTPPFPAILTNVISLTLRREKEIYR